MGSKEDYIQKRINKVLETRLDTDKVTNSQNFIKNHKINCFFFCSGNIRSFVRFVSVF